MSFRTEKQKRIESFFTGIFCGRNRVCMSFYNRDNQDYGRSQFPMARYIVPHAIDNSGYNDKCIPDHALAKCEKDSKHIEKKICPGIRVALFHTLFILFYRYTSSIPDIWIYRFRSTRPI